MLKICPNLSVYKEQKHALMSLISKSQSVTDNDWWDKFQINLLLHTLRDFPLVKVWEVDNQLEDLILKEVH